MNLPLPYGGAAKLLTPDSFDVKFSATRLYLVSSCLTRACVCTS